MSVNQILLQVLLYNGRVCAVIGKKPRIYTAHFIAFSNKYKMLMLNTQNKVSKLNKMISLLIVAD